MDCNLCGSANHKRLIDFGSQPIAHNYLDVPAKEEPRYPFVFHFCGDCGHMFLGKPIDPDLLYENYVTVSDWKFQPHIPRLVELIGKFTSVNERSRVLEVGSNDGRFLDVLRSQGFCNLVGIEPAQDALESARAKGIRTIPGYFNQSTSEAYLQEYGSCELLIARQVLEHITDLKEFGQAIQDVLPVGGYVLIEVPDFSCNLEFLDYSLWEEHINYFNTTTLERYLRGIGVRTIHKETVLFSGRTLIVIGERIGAGDHDSTLGLGVLQESVDNYAKQWPVFRSEFNEWLQRQDEKASKIAVYGAGARVCSLINFTDAGKRLVCFVDDQEEKQNLYMPGSKLSILPSDHLETDAIDLCLLAVNSESESSAMAKHSEFIRRGGEFYSVLPPSDRLPPFWKERIHRCQGPCQAGI